MEGKMPAQGTAVKEDAACSFTSNFIASRTLFGWQALRSAKKRTPSLFLAVHSKDIRLPGGTPTPDRSHFRLSTWREAQ